MCLGGNLAYFSSYLCDMAFLYLRAACVKIPLQKGCYNLTRAPSLKTKPLKMHGEATGSSLTTSLRDFTLISLLRRRYSKCHIQLEVYKGPVMSSGLWSGMQDEFLFQIILSLALKSTSAKYSYVIWQSLHRERKPSLIFSNSSWMN